MTERGFRSLTSLLAPWYDSSWNLRWIFQLDPLVSADLTTELRSNFCQPVLVLDLMGRANTFESSSVSTSSRALISPDSPRSLLVLRWSSAFRTEPCWVSARWQNSTDSRPPTSSATGGFSLFTQIFLQGEILSRYYDIHLWGRQTYLDFKEFCENILIQ